MRRAACAVLALLATPAFATDEISLLIERDQLRQAEPLLAARVAAAPTDALALARLARIRVEQGKFEEALPLAERAVAAAPQSAEARYALAEAHGAKAQRGGIGAMGPARKFRKEAEATLALDARHADALVGLIEFHSQAPGIVGGDKKKIPELLERLAAVHPARAAMRRAAQASRAKDSLTAEAHLRAAAETGDVEARLSYAGWLAAPWRKPAEAERIAREIVATEPWRQNAWGVMATLQAGARRYDELDATLAAAEAADPGRLGAMYAAARTMVTEGGDLERAEKYLRRYLALPPEIGYPSHAGARWRLAQVLEKKGERDAAVTELKLAVREQPDLEGAKKDLRRLSR